MRAAATVPARWNNTGGDVLVHLVPAGTEVLVDPSQAEVWAYSGQVTVPVCGLSEYHGHWTKIDLPARNPYRYCVRCFPVLAEVNHHGRRVPA